MRSCILLLAVVGAVVGDAKCQREFFAQPVVYDRAMSIDFYYTAINLSSVADCAAFCGDRHFCRTAVYNLFAKTCAISYEYTLNCRYNDKRLTEFDLRNSSSHLIQIACVTKCNEISTPNALKTKKKLLLADSIELSSATPATLKKVELITGEPNDGLRESTAAPKVARSRPVIQKDKIQEPGFVNKLLIENFTTAGILPVLDSTHIVRRKGQICYRLREKKYLMGAAYETHKDVSLQTCRCLCAHSYEQNSIFMCKSFNWRADGTCELNKGNHLGRFDMIDDNRYIYQFIDCDVQVLIGIATKFCTKEGKAISSTTTTTDTPMSTITVAQTELTSETNPPTSVTTETTTVGEHTSSVETTTEVTTSSEKVTSAEERAGFFVPSRKETSSETTVETTTTEAATTAETTPEAAASSTAPSTEESTIKLESITPIITETATTLTTIPDSVLNIEKSVCFERIGGYMMGSVAAALEHDVSLEECECFCANSRASGRHGFDCSSATYYHGERDCVLNLENRHQRTKYFSKQADFNVTYLGMTCPRDEAISSLVKPEKTYGCRETPQMSKPKKTKAKGAFSDQCFTELPSYVLEGNALHVETNATPQRCKCLCLAAEQKFGEACQSFQYYYEGAVCLLSKDNRYSNAQNFTFLPDQQLRSYFEYKCASKEEKLKSYMEQSCLFQKVIDDTPSEKKIERQPADDDISRKLILLNTTSSEEKTIEGSGAESNETVISTDSTTVPTTILSTTTEETTTIPSTTISSTTKKMRTRRPINRAIPETEGLDESDFDNALEGILSNHLDDPVNMPANTPFNRVHGVKTIKFTDKIEKAVQVDSTSTTVTKPPPTTVITTTKTLTTIPTTRKIIATTRRPLPTTTKGPEYPSAGKCTYSALYQTAFFGRRTIKTVHVKTASDCFAACFALHCRSANLIAQGALNQCELFRDSLIDYRRPDMIGYDGSTVYFDGIRCDGI